VTESTNRGPRQSLSTAERGKRDDDTPGYRRRSLAVVVPSIKEPLVKPRMTKAASLRTGESMPVTIREEVDVETTFNGVPGHKRGEVIFVASSKPPTIAPRGNKSAALRASKSPIVASPTKPVKTTSDFHSRTESLGSEAEGTVKHGQVVT